MDFDIINELNSKGTPFLVRLIEENEHLCIEICGSVKQASFPSDAEKLGEWVDSTGGNGKKLREMILNSTEVLPDDSVIYRFYFENYIGYSTRYETYTTWDDSESFDYGKAFRVYTKSKYLDYIENATHAKLYERKITHYGIYCEWQIIDVVSFDEPSITKITKN